jgi:hypothetical protein
MPATPLDSSSRLPTDEVNYSHTYVFHTPSHKLVECPKRALSLIHHPGKRKRRRRRRRKSSMHKQTNKQTITQTRLDRTHTSRAMDSTNVNEFRHKFTVRWPIRQLGKILRSTKHGCNKQQQKNPNSNGLDHFRKRDTCGIQLPPYPSWFWWVGTTVDGKEKNKSKEESKNRSAKSRFKHFNNNHLQPNTELRNTMECWNGSSLSSITPTTAIHWYWMCVCRKGLDMENRDEKQYASNAPLLGSPACTTVTTLSFYIHRPTSNCWRTVPLSTTLTRRDNEPLQRQLRSW